MKRFLLILGIIAGLASPGFAVDNQCVKPDQHGKTGYNSTGKDCICTPASGTFTFNKHRIAVRECTLYQESGSDAAGGIAARLPASALDFCQKDDSATPDCTFTDALDTKAFTATTGKVTLFTTTNNDGYAVLSTRPFSRIVIDLQAGAGESLTPTYKYWNGTALTAITPTTQADYQTGGGTITFVDFIPPHDWVTGCSTTEDTDSCDGLYYLEAVAGTAPSNTVQANQLWVARVLDQATITDASYINIKYDPAKLLAEDECVMPVFATAHAKNAFTCDMERK